MFGLLVLFWLFYQVAGMIFFGVDFLCNLIQKKKFKPYIAKRSALGEGCICKAFLLDFQKLYRKFSRRMVREYS